MRAILPSLEELKWESKVQHKRNYWHKRWGRKDKRKKFYIIIITETTTTTIYLRHFHINMKVINRVRREIKFRVLPRTNLIKSLWISIELKNSYLPPISTWLTNDSHMTTTWRKMRRKKIRLKEKLFSIENFYLTWEWKCVGWICKKVNRIRV